MSEFRRAGPRRSGDGALPANRQRNIALLVAGTFFMEILDGTIVTTAAPSIGSSLGVPSVAVGVTITAYLLALAVTIPLSGWMTLRFGSRRIFLVAIAIFTIASVLCASSTNLTELTLMRVLQGIGGAMMVPVGRLAVLRVTDRGDLVRTIALLTWPALAAPVVAPLVGGLLTTYASWHWIFLINVPLGLIAFAAALRLLPGEPIEKPPQLDVVGFVLTCIGLGALVYFGSLISDPALMQLGSAALETILVATIGVVFTVLASLHLVRTRHPLLELRALRIETFRLAHAGGSLFRLTVNAVPFLLPLLFQDVFGWSPVLSGTLVLFIFVGNIAIKPATTPLLRRFGFRTVIIAASSGVVVSVALLAVFDRQTPIWLIVVILVIGGIARSTGFTAYNTIAFADITRSSMTDANTLASTLQQLAAGFGVAVGALALRGGQLLSGADGEASFRFAFFALAALAALATVEALLLNRAAGQSIRPAVV